MRLGPWHRLIVLATLILVAASGVLWFVLHDVLDHPSDEVMRALLILHGVTSFATGIAFGSVLPLHALKSYQQRRHLVTGLSVTATLAVLIGTALLLYYGSEETREWARLVHLIAGFAFIAVMVVHVIAGRRLRRATLARS